MSNFPSPTVARAGANKNAPFTILVVANPVLEAPIGTGQFMADPIVQNQAAFNACVAYVERALFGTLPNQAQRLLGDPAIAPQVRFLSLFKAGSAGDRRVSLAGQDSSREFVMDRVRAKLLR